MTDSSFPIDIITPQTVAAEMARLAGLLDAGLAAVRAESRKSAEAEAEYRKGKSKAWAESRLAIPEAIAKEREAWVDAKSADLRFVRDLSVDTRQAALEAVRSRRAQISALQSLLASHREEASFARTGPDY